MTLDSKNMRLDDKDLTEREYSFLITLLSNEVVKTERIYKFLYREENDKYNKTRRLSVIKKRLVEKTGLEITTKNNVGYTLKDCIQIV